MPTGAQIRARSQRRGLVELGKTTSVGVGAYLVDATRQKFGRMSPQEYNDCFIRILSGDSNNNGNIFQVDHADPANGRIYLTPTPTNAIATTTTYELWRYGIDPDDYDRSRDRALTEKCSYWPLKPLSMLSEVTSWATGAYAADTGGVSNAAASAVTMAAPNEYGDTSRRITNSGADGYGSSESLLVQPGQTYRLFGYVSVRAQTASIRVRRTTATAADITLSGTSTFTLFGWQYFEVTFTVPAGCDKIEVWLGGASASCIADWAAVGLLPQQATEIVLSSAVTSPRNVGCVYSHGDTSNVQSADRRGLVELACWRERAFKRVRLRFPGVVSTYAGVYYEHRTFYTALSSEYLSASDRTTGDAASTDCPVEYAEAAAVVDLLRDRALSEDLNRIFLAAVQDLQYYERQYGPDPKVPATPGRGRPSLPRL